MHVIALAAVALPVSFFMSAMYPSSYTTELYCDERRAKACFGAMMAIIGGAVRTAAMGTISDVGGSIALTYLHACVRLPLGVRLLPLRGAAGPGQLGTSRRILTDQALRRMLDWIR